jgi:hypothetical protein
MTDTQLNVMLSVASYCNAESQFFALIIAVMLIVIMLRVKAPKVTNLYFLVTDILDKYDKMTDLGKYFGPSLTFVRHSEAYLSGAPL